MSGEREIKDVSVAEFRVDGRKYLICPQDPCSPAKEGKSVDGLSSDRIAGEARILGKRYFIIAGDCIRETDEADREKRLSDRLTKRELQIVLLVAEGCANKAIADRLNISEWTVSTHIRRIFVKLGVDSRAAMVFRCFGAFTKTPEKITEPRNVKNQGSAKE